MPRKGKLLAQFRSQDSGPTFPRQVRFGELTTGSKRDASLQSGHQATKPACHISRATIYAFRGLLIGASISQLGEPGCQRVLNSRLFGQVLWEKRELSQDSGILALFRSLVDLILSYVRKLNRKLSVYLRMVKCNVYLIKKMIDSIYHMSKGYNLQRGMEISYSISQHHISVPPPD